MKTARRLLSVVLSLVITISTVGVAAVSAFAADSGIDSSDNTASGISAKPQRQSFMKPKL